MPEGVGYGSNNIQTRSTVAARSEVKADATVARNTQRSNETARGRVDVEINARQRPQVNVDRSSYEQIGQTQLRAEARGVEQRAVEQLQQRRALTSQRDQQVSRASIATSETRPDERAARAPSAPAGSVPTERTTNDALAVRVQQQSFSSAEKPTY
jgi:hypothetical protein